MQERRAIKNTDLFIWLEENEFDKIIEKCNYKILNYQKDEYVAFRGDEISNKAQFLSKNLWESLSNKTINQKLVEYILKNEKDGVFIFDRSIKDLAEYFNVSRPSLSRVIKKFIEDKVIEKLEKGKYKILSKEKLIIIQ